MKHFFFILCAIALHAGAMAQNIILKPVALDPMTGEYFSETEFRGRIVDSLTRQPLPSAVVSVVGREFGENAVRQFVTDKEGRFRFACSIGPNNRMEINHLGYSIRTIYLNTDAPKRDLGDVWLAEDPTGIDAVVVQSRLKMYEIRGDTIIFLPKAVKTMEGEKALEILRQMPGVEVSDGGGITVFGKPVERTYVNSRLLFGEDPTTALKQLEAEEVASIQSYDEVDEQEVALHGENARKRKVLNVVTFGEFSKSFAANAHVEAGAGFEPDVENNRPARYNATADAGYYSEALQVSLRGSSGNLTESVSSKPLPGLKRRSDLSASVSGKAKGKHDYRLSYKYNTSTNKQNRISEQNYFPTEYYTSRHQADTTRSKKSDQGHRFDAAYSYTGKKTFFDTELNGNFSDQTGAELFRQQTVQDGRMLLDLLRTSNSRGDNSHIHWSGHFKRKIEENQYVSASVNIDRTYTENNRLRHEAETENEQTTRTELIFRNASPAPGIGVNGSVSYGLNLEKAGQLSLSARVGYNSIGHRITATDAATGETDPALSDAADDRTLTGEVSLTYLFTRGRHSLSIAPSYQSISLDHRDRLRDSRDDRTYHGLLAAINYTYSRTKGTTTFSLNASQQAPYLRDLSSRLDDTNPLNLRVGNPRLAPEKQYYAKFSHNDMVGKEGSLSIDGAITLTDDAILTTRTYFREDTPLPDYGNYLAPAGSSLWRPENSGKYIQVRANMSYKTPLRPLRCLAEFSVSYDYGNPRADLGQGPKRTERHNGTFEARFTTNFSSKFRIILSSRTDALWYRNPDGNRNRNITECAEATLRWDIGRFFAQGSYNMWVERNDTFSAADSDIHQLNLMFGCRLWNRNASIIFNAYDILNRQTGQIVWQGAQSVSIYRDRVYGSYFTFAFEYKFNRRK